MVPGPQDLKNSRTNTQNTTGKKTQINPRRKTQISSGTNNPIIARSKIQITQRAQIHTDPAQERTQVPIRSICTETPGIGTKNYPLTKTYCRSLQEVCKPQVTLGTKICNTPETVSQIISRNSDSDHSRNEDSTNNKIRSLKETRLRSLQQLDLHQSKNYHLDHSRN